MMLVPSIEALTIGNCRKAAVAARTANGRNVRLMPYCCRNGPLSFSRILAILVMSTRCTVVTCAEVRLLNTMCSPIFWRMVLMGSTLRAGAAPGICAISRGAAGALAGAAGGGGVGCAMVATAVGAGGGVGGAG